MVDIHHHALKSTTSAGAVRDAQKQAGCSGSSGLSRLSSLFG
jgi:hypothetical protein